MSLCDILKIVNKYNHTRVVVDGNFVLHVIAAHVAVVVVGSCSYLLVLCGKEKKLQINIGISFITIIKPTRATNKRAVDDLRVVAIRIQGLCQKKNAYS